MKHHLLKNLCMLTVLALLLPCVGGPGVLSASGADSELVNLAEQATLTSDSAWDDPEGYWRLSFLTDGSKLTPWPLPAGQTLGWRSARHDSRNANIKLTFALPRTATVSRVDIYPRGGGQTFPDDYAVSVSDDGVTWKTVASVTGDTEIRSEGRQLSFSPVTACFVRVEITKLSAEKDGNDQVCTLSEIEIWGTSEQTVMITPNKDTLWLKPGESDTLTATVKGLPDGEELALTFSSSDPSVAEVDAKGRVTAKGEGEATITMWETGHGGEAVCRVIVDKEKNQVDNILITVPMWGNDRAITEEQFLWLRDADIDAVMAVGHDNSVVKSERMLDIAQSIWDPARERNLKVFVHSYLNGIIPASADEEVIAHAEQYRNTLAFMGYHVEDEPWDPLPYARLERLLREHDPASITDINFLPGMVYGSYDEYYARLSDYAKMLEDKKSYLSFDNYPFGPATGSVNEEALFGNFETMRRAGLDNDIPTAFYLQGVGSDHYGYRRPTEGVLRYHIAAGLSYGFKWIKYFSWHVPGATGTGEADLFMDAIMDHEDQKTELYDVASTLNREVHNVGDILVTLTSKEVYHSGKKSTSSAYETLPSDFFVQPVGDAYAIVSLFEKNDSGEQYLMIVNKDFDRPATLSFRLDGVSSLVEIDKTVDDGTLTPDYKNGVLTRSFKAGEFALYRLAERDADYGTAPVTYPNLLVGAASYANSSVTGNGYCIAYAHDGQGLSSPTRMGWRASCDGQDASILFDLGESRAMNRLDVYPAGLGVGSGASYPTALTLLVSDNGTDWREVLAVTDMENPKENVPTFTFDTAKGRYVKIILDGIYEVAVGELALYMDDGSIPAPPATTYREPSAVPKGENLAAGKRVITSESYMDGAWNPAFAVDGHKMESWPTDKTLGWCSTWYDTRDVEDVFLMVDMGRDYRIDTITLYPRGNNGLCYPTDYTVEISTDMESWTVVHRAVDEEDIGETPRTFTFEPSDARFVRVNVTKLNPRKDTNYACQFSEIEILAAEQETDPSDEKETEFDTSESNTVEPDTPEPDTETPTEPVESETTEPDTDTPADTTPDSETEPDTEKPKGGCGSAMLSCAAVLGAAAGAVALKKKKEH